MNPTKARALADRLDDGDYAGMSDVSAALRSLAAQLERQAEALTILDGFKGPPPAKYQWEAICALAQSLKEAIRWRAT